jgi:hypothetical protein
MKYLLSKSGLIASSNRGLGCIKSSHPFSCPQHHTVKETLASLFELILLFLLLKEDLGLFQKSVENQFSFELTETVET